MDCKVNKVRHEKNKHIITVITNAVWFQNDFANNSYSELMIDYVLFMYYMCVSIYIYEYE